MLFVDKCIEILNKGTSGVLALLGDYDYPYAIPISCTVILNYTSTVIKVVIK